MMDIMIINGGSTIMTLFDDQSMDNDDEIISLSVGNYQLWLSHYNGGYYHYHPGMSLFYPPNFWDKMG